MQKLSTRKLFLTCFTVISQNLGFLELFQYFSRNFIFCLTDSNIPKFQRFGSMITVCPFPNSNPNPNDAKRSNFSLFIKDIVPQFQPFSHLLTIFPKFSTKTCLFLPNPRVAGFRFDLPEWYSSDHRSKLESVKGKNLCLTVLCHPIKFGKFLWKFDIRNPF